MAEIKNRYDVYPSDQDLLVKLIESGDKVLQKEGKQMPQGWGGGRERWRGQESRNSYDIYLLDQDLLAKLNNYGNKVLQKEGKLMPLVWVEGGRGEGGRNQEIGMTSTCRTKIDWWSLFNLGTKCCRMKVSKWLLGGGRRGWGEREIKIGKTLKICMMSLYQTKICWLSWLNLDGDKALQKKHVEKMVGEGDLLWSVPIRLRFAG